MLGSILIDPESLNLIADIVREEDFYLEEHQRIFSAMHRLFLVNKQIDLVTLIDTLVHQGVYDRSGGEIYIRTLAEVVPGAQNIKDYAAIVRDKSLLRQTIAACEESAAMAYEGRDEVSQILDLTQNKLYAIAQGRETKTFRHINEIMVDVYGRLQALAQNKESEQNVQTGFSGLDRVLAGMGRSDLVLIGARPGMGKTSFALNIATNVASATGKTVCIFSLEMSAEQLVTRVISSEAMIDSYALRKGTLTAEDWPKLAAAASHLAKCNILIDDTSGITVTAMKAKLRRVKDLGLVVIDYLQLMQSDRRIDNRVQEVAEISRAMKIMAKELNVPVICCAQLSRGPESRTDKKPMLSDLRDSGAIEQDADTVLFLYRDEYYKTAEQSPDNQAPTTVEVIIAKNRHGSVGKVTMGWIGRFTKFRTIADEPS